MSKEIKKKKRSKGFTLIEILVVVLIIGILAAIALSKYQVVVAKSQFSTLKFETKAFAQAINQYRIANGEEPQKFADLDVTIASTEVDYPYKPSIVIRTSNGELCSIINTWNPKAVSCFLANTKMRYYFDTENLKPLQCVSLSNYEAGIKVCQQETNKQEYDTSSCGILKEDNTLTGEPCVVFYY